MIRIFSARWVLPVTAAPIEHGAIAVRDGRILFVGTKTDCAASFPETSIQDFGNAVILPGLINTHSHLELTGFRGRLETANFFNWISTLVRLKRERLSEEDVRLSSLMGCAEAVRNGITTVGDTADSKVVVEALSVSGLRGLVFQEFFGPDTSQAQQSIEGLQQKLQEHRNYLSASGAESRITLGISPHAPYSVSAELYRKAAELTLREKLDVAIHAAESRDESLLLQDGSGAFGEMLRARGIKFTPPGVSTIRYFEDLGILETRPLLIHCVSADESDLQLVASAKARIAHCPKSNAKFGHGIAPWAAMKTLGITIGVGTDSVASNNRMDLLEEARFGAYLHRAHQRDGEVLKAEEMLRLVTIDNARALGIDQQTGSLEIDKAADLAVISLDQIGPCHDVESAVAFAAQGQDVRFTMTAGEVLYDDGRYPKIDIKELSEASEQLTLKLGENP